MSVQSYSFLLGSTIWYQRRCLLFQQDFESVLHTLIRLCVCCIFHITWQQFPQISKLHVCHMYSQFIHFSPCTYQRCFYKLEITASFFIAIYKKLKKNLAFIIPQKLWSETECKCTKMLQVTFQHYWMTMKCFYLKYIYIYYSRFFVKINDDLDNVRCLK